MYWPFDHTVHHLPSHSSPLSPQNLPPSTFFCRKQPHYLRSPLPNTPETHHRSARPLHRLHSSPNPAPPPSPTTSSGHPAIHPPNRFSLSRPRRHYSQCRLPAEILSFDYGHSQVPQLRGLIKFRASVGHVRRIRAPRLGKRVVGLSPDPDWQLYVAGDGTEMQTFSSSAAGVAARTL